MEFINKTFFVATVGVYHFNRTNFAINATFNLLHKIESLYINVTAFKFMSNEYRLSPIQFTEDGQKVLNQNMFDMLTLTRNFTKPPFTILSEIKPKVIFQ